MGRIVVSTGITVDGYTTGPGDDLSSMPFDAAFGEHNAALMGQASAVLFGARFFRQAVAYWPGQVGADDPRERQIAERYASGLPLVVASDTLTVADLGAWRDQTTLVTRDQLADTVAQLRAQDGDTVVFGGATLWRHLVAEGWVDLLHVLVLAGIVAGDQPAFAGVPPTGLTLRGVERFEGTSSVLLSYAVSSSDLPPSAP